MIFKHTFPKLSVLGIIIKFKKIKGKTNKTPLTVLGIVRALPLFYKFSLYFSLFLLSLSLSSLLIFFIIFRPYLVPSRLALLTPGFPFFLFLLLSLLE